MKTKTVKLFVLLIRKDDETEIKKEVYKYEEDRDRRAYDLKRFYGANIHTYLATEEFEEYEG